VPGKGYFIQNVELRQEQKVFLLLNKMSAHKKVFFESFIAALGEHAIVDLFIYNNDFSLYKRSLSERKDEYSYYVVIPYTLEGEERGIELIDAIPRDKLIVLDKNIPGIQGDYAAVYEHFEEDIYVALEKARESLSKYNKIKIVFPHYSYHPFEILKGCRRFCEDYGFQFEEVQDLGNEPIGEGEVYITLMEEDLVTLAERIVSQQLALGRQVGVISYNETPLKRIILNGITTISTDFQQMGKMTAQMVLEHCRQQKAVPFNLELRGSL
jgi:DNA-binding LacI/PurR family transcriptional regulator